MTTYTVNAAGPFDLARCLEFLEAWPAGQAPMAPGRLDYATCGEDDWTPVAVSLTATAEGITVTTSRPVGAVLRRQITRTVSLDVDATTFPDVGRCDPLIAALQAQRPGLRPVLFWSPWEAAVWAVLSQRTSMREASLLKGRITASVGHRVDQGGLTLHAFPGPLDIVAGADLPGVPQAKRDRIAALARTAIDGILTGDHLRSLDPDDAISQLCQLPGIGPFSAALITIRGAGHPDVFVSSEARLLRRVADCYGTGTPASENAERWKPFRSWVAFLLRSATPHQLAAGLQSHAQFDVVRPVDPDRTVQDPGC
jgi:DNA-3-methyladenine glycosylase II